MQQSAIGKRAGQYAAEFARSHKDEPVDAAQVDVAAKRSLAAFDRGVKGEGPYQIQYELQEKMQELVGIVRMESEMKQALEVIDKLHVREANVGIDGNRMYNNGWHTAMDLRHLLTVSEAITRAAILRQESRGAQFREDFQGKDPEWGKYNLVVKKTDSGMAVEKRPIGELTPELKQIIEEMK